MYMLLKFEACDKLHQSGLDICISDIIMIGTTILRRTPRSLLLNAAHRSVSSTVPRAQRFLLYAPDKTEEGILARRFQVRPQHLERIHVFLKNGTLSKIITSLLMRSMVYTSGRGWRVDGRPRVATRFGKGGSDRLVYDTRGRDVGGCQGTGGI